MEQLTALNFSVTYDGTDLRKPVVLAPREPGGEAAFLRRFSYSGDKVSAKGYFYVQHGTIKPEELQGVLVRIRHAAVGGYDSTFLSFPATEGSLIQRWVSAEVWADDRLEDALNIDRRTLRVAHPAYAELQAALHKKLRAVIAEARRLLYEPGRANRRVARAAMAARALAAVASEDIAPVSGRAAA